MIALVTPADLNHIACTLKEKPEPVSEELQGFLRIQNWQDRSFVASHYVPQ
jgi:hypothetical protein